MEWREGRIQPNPDVVFSEEAGGKGLLYNPETDTAFSLNRMSLLIWKRVSGSLTEEAFHRAVTETFKDVPEDLEQHVDAFLDKLYERGLVEKVGP